MRIFAPRTSALRISTFCFMPTGMSMTLASGSTCRLYFSAYSFVMATAFAWSMKRPLRGAMPSTMFSATVRLGTSMKCWCTMPIPWEMATVGEVSDSFSPFTQISPLVGCSRPKSIFMSVDLPAPFSPISAWISPLRRKKSTPWLAATPLGYTLVIPFIWTTYCSSGRPVFSSGIRYVPLFLQKKFCV